MMRRFFVLLCSIALAGLTTFGAVPAGAAMTVDVNPNTAVSLGWGFLEETPSGSGDFELGPATPPDGVGSARISTDPGGGMAFGMLGYGGTRLDEVSALGYSTYRSSADAGNNMVPSMQMPIDYDVTDLNQAYQGRIVYGPSTTYPGGVPEDTWQSWDPMAGLWWATGAPGTTACPQASPCTWAALLAAFPDAGIHASPYYGGVLFKAGAWGSGFDGNVDAFSITTAASGTDTYDFEPLNTVPCYVSHAEDLVGVRYRSFGNTGSNEIYEGVPDLGTTPRAEAGLTWLAGDNTFSFTYSPVTGLSTSVNGSAPLTRSLAQLTSDMSTKGKTLTLADLNVMQVTVKNQSNVVGPQPSVVVKDLTVDGVPIDADTNTPATIDDMTGVAGSTLDWMLTGLDFVDGFTATGNISLTAGTGWGLSAEGSRVELKVGHYDDSVVVNVGDASAPEVFGTADVAITATGTRMRPVEMLVSTADVTATAGLDYTATTDAIVFQPCSSGSTVIPVPILPDALIEGTETLGLSVSQVLGATVGDGTGTISILDNDGFRISDLTVAEGDAGARTVAKFSVNLSQAQPTLTTVNYSMVNGTATVLSGDYKYQNMKTLKFKAGQTTKPVTVRINGDTAPEGDENFSVVLSGSSGPLIVDATGVATIREDDSPTAGSPELRASDAAVWEGDSGLKNKVWVTVSLSSAAVGVVTVTAATADGSATIADLDYKAWGPKTLTFAPGQTSRRVGITYYPNAVSEGDETFDLVLSGPSGAPIGDGTGTVTIRDED